MRTTADAARFGIRPIAACDDARIAAIIREVMTEFGADGPGFAIHDAEVSAMSAAYADLRRAYFVVELDGIVQGGGGFAPLENAEGDICELRKMYFRRPLRGCGAGSALIELCMRRARAEGFTRCYIETLTGMDAAEKLYVGSGFQRIERALGATGHHGCNRYYLREL